MSDEEIRSLIPLDYPESLLQLSLIDLEENLQTKIPVEDVEINKRFIPPSLTIQVTEKNLLPSL